MSLDRSLKSANSLVRHRNVLTRAERLDKLKEEEKWSEDKSVFGLPKVEHRKQEAIKGPAKEEAAEGAAVAGATPAAGTAPAPAAPGAKGAGGANKAAAPAAAGKAPAAPSGKKK